LQKCISDNDPEFVNEILTLFVTEVPEDLAQIKEGIKRKIISMPMLCIKIKPTLDLLGLNVAFEEILQVEAWTKVEGKEKISIILSRA
jgi:hypothetical protein